MLRWHVSKSARTSALILAVLVLGLASDHLRSRAHGAFVESQSYEDTYYLPPNAWLRVFSLGWDEAFADLIWMRALIYYGDELRHDGAVQFVFRYGEAIETLDPNFVAIYSWVGMASLYRPQATTVDDIERAVTFMRRGAERHPNDGELAWDLGATLAYELPPMVNDTEAADRARARAVPFLVRAVQLGAAPRWATMTNAAILTRIGRTEQAARHLEEMYDQTSDPRTRQRMAARIRQLRGEVEGEAFLATMRELEAQRRAHFPYAPQGLFLLLGERPVVDIDGPIRDGLPAALSHLDSDEP